MVITIFLAASAAIGVQALPRRLQKAFTNAIAKSGSPGIKHANVQCFTSHE
jgi:hypothetical protein